MREDFVKSVGHLFLYSQKAIDLVEAYLTRFSALFVILSRHDSGQLLYVHDFEEYGGDHGMAFIEKVTKWLDGLPYLKDELKNVNTIELSAEAYDDVKRAVQISVSRTNRYIPYTCATFNHIVFLHL